MTHSLVNIQPAPPVAPVRGLLLPATLLAALAERADLLAQSATVIAREHDRSQHADIFRQYARVWADEVARLADMARLYDVLADARTGAPLGGVALPNLAPIPDDLPALHPPPPERPIWQSVAHTPASTSTPTAPITPKPTRVRRTRSTSKGETTHGH